MTAKTARQIQELFALFGARTFFEFHTLYVAEDQRLIKAGLWDPTNEVLLTNQAKEILTQLSPIHLDDEGKKWVIETLWFWHHHAITCEKQRTWALMYARSALLLQEAGHPNRITKLLYFLVCDNVTAAREWLMMAPNDPDFQTGLETIEDYEKKPFWV